MRADQFAHSLRPNISAHPVRERDRLYRRLTDLSLLWRAWHMTRAEIRDEFIEDLYRIDCFAARLQENLQEIAHRLSSGSYRPRPLIRAEVPKSGYSTRPVAVVSIPDRIILCAAMLLIIEQAGDQLFDESVYSYRLKPDWRTRWSADEDTRPWQAPFLDRSLIQAEISPFEHWRESWPAFDAAARAAFTRSGYSALAMADFAAFYENVQLALLRDQLLSLLPDEPSLVEIVLSFFESWTLPAIGGSRIARGIPQGSDIVGFYPGLLLRPLDATMAQFCAANDAIYLRYVDDLRIFARTERIARAAILELERCARSLHLNIQTSKLAVYSEGKGEITRALVDDRVDRLVRVRDSLRAEKLQAPLSPERARHYAEQLSEIAMQRPNNPNEVPLLGADRPLTGLSLRAFRLWISCQVALDRDDCVVPLLGEVRRNPNVRLIRTLVAAAQRHPRNEVLKQGLISLLDSSECLLPHSVAEIIRALRYLSVLEDRLVIQCYERLHDRSGHFYVRAQCAYLLNRVPLSAEQLDRCARAFENEPDPQVKIALAGLLVQQAPNLNVIRRLVAHPNEEVQQFGTLLQAMAYDRRAAGRKLVYVLSPPMDRRLVDSMPLLYAMLHSPDGQICAILRDALAYAVNNTALDGLRPVLLRLARQCSGESVMG